tara:strand:- start:389 stop:832 length:444 start_codon:yes stop_codon:yes gene_type:complete
MYLPIQYKMAQLLIYGGSSVAAYFVGRNILGRATNNALDYVLNSNADDSIKDIHMVKSIGGMLKSYRGMKSDHPAYEAMIAVREGLNKLKAAIDNALLKREAHRQGYVSRFRTYDASIDNKKIDSLCEDLMKRLELFTNLIQLKEEC